MASHVSLTFLWLILLYTSVVFAFTDTESEKENQTGTTCSFGFLPCDNGACVARKGWCNGEVQCEDASDEAYCFPLHPLATISDVKLTCSKKHFSCANGMCIPLVARCDDMPDCKNWEDEEGCWNDDGDAFDAALEDSTQSATENVTVYEVTNETNLTTTDVETTASTTPSATLISKEDETMIDQIVSAQKISDLSIVSSSSSSSSGDDSLERGVRYLLQQRDNNWGWGESTARFATALYLTNDSYFDSSSYDGQLTKKQLEVQLALDLMRVSRRPLRLDQLENYINSLLATCADPRNFHGINLLKMLKRQVKHLLAKGQFVNPLAYLALCNADDLPDEYISRIKNVAYRRSEEPMWLDIQAIALLTISCKSRNNPSSTEWKIMRKDVAKNITEWQQRDGSFGSMYSTGLVLQALSAANETGTEDVQARALSYLKTHQNWEGSFGNELDNFYVLPNLNFKSLASVSERRCTSDYTATLNIEAGHREKEQKKINVHYSLWIGGQKNEIHTLTLGVKPHTSFLEIMEQAQQVNSKYKFEVWDTDRGPVINSVAEKSSDVEKGTYWTLYRKVPLQFRPDLSNKTATIARLKLFGARRFIKDLRKLFPKDKEHLAFWLKPYF